MFWRVILNKLLECIFENVEIARVIRLYTIIFHGLFPPPPPPPRSHSVGLLSCQEEAPFRFIIDKVLNMQCWITEQSSCLFEASPRSIQPSILLENKMSTNLLGTIWQNY